MIKSKKAFEWWIIVSLILLVITAVIIILYLNGTFTKLGDVGHKGLFGWLDATK